MRTARFQENCSFPTFCDEEIELSTEDFVIALEFKISLYLAIGLLFFVFFFFLLWTGGSVDKNPSANAGDTDLIVGAL